MSRGEIRFPSVAAKMDLPADRRELVALLEESAHRFADPSYIPEEVVEWFEQESHRLLLQWNAIS